MAIKTWLTETVGVRVPIVQGGEYLDSIKLSIGNYPDFNSGNQSGMMWVGRAGMRGCFLYTDDKAD
jgi:hypothetical protein